MKTINELIKATRGKFFHVEFIKKDGTLRPMTARTGVSKHVKGVGMSYDPSTKGLIPVWDAARKAYRMINTATVKSFRCGKVEWRHNGTSS